MKFLLVFFLVAASVCLASPISVLEASKALRELAEDKTPAVAANDRAEKQGAAAVVIAQMRRMEVHVYDHWNWMRGSTTAEMAEANRRTLLSDLQSLQKLADSLAARILAGTREEEVRKATDALRHAVDQFTKELEEGKPQ